MEFVRNFASKVTVMHEGKLLKEGSMEEVQRDDRVAEVYLGKGGMSMLAVQQLEAGYGESVILRSVTLKVKPGQVVCLLGRNGVGKTTLMKSIMGVLKARRGSISYNGEDITKRAPGERAKQGIGYVPQGREIFPQLTVFENVLLGLEASKEKKRTIPESAIAKFPVLPTMYGRRGGDLSGGQQQQLAFARALARNRKCCCLTSHARGSSHPSLMISGMLSGRLRRMGRQRFCLRNRVWSS